MTSPSGLEAFAFLSVSAVILGSALLSVFAKRTFHSVMFLGLTLAGVGGLYVLLGSTLIGVLQILVYVGGILTLFVFAVMFVAGDETETDDEPVATRATMPQVVFLGVNVLLNGAALGALFVPVIGAFAVLTGAHPQFSAGTWSASSPSTWFLGLGGWRWFVAGAMLTALVVGYVVALVKARWSRKVALAGAVNLAGLLLIVVGMTSAWLGAAPTDAPTTASQTSTLVDLLFDTWSVPLEVLGLLLTAAMIGALVIARPLGQAPDASNYTKPDHQLLAQTIALSDPKATTLHAVGEPEAVVTLPPVEPMPPTASPAEVEL